MSRPILAREPCLRYAKGSGRHRRIGERPLSLGNVKIIQPTFSSRKSSIDMEDSSQLLLVKENDRAVIILPESTFKEGWNILVAKIENFINRNSTTLITNKLTRLLNQTRGRIAIKRCFSGTNGLRETKRKMACWANA